MTRNREIVLTFIAVMVGLACAGSLVRTWGMSGSEAASWAQAIGTVAAILASGYFARQQIGAADRQRRNERIEFIHAAMKAAEYATDGLVSVDAVLPTSNVDALKIVVGATIEPTWSSAIREFIDLPVDRWPSSFLYLRATQFIHAYDKFEEFIIQCAGYPHLTDTEWSRARSIRANLDAHQKLLTDACNAAIGRLG